MPIQFNLSGIFKAYETSGSVLKGLNLAVAQGESVAIVGASGCGKSTLLNMMGTLDRPDEGEIVFGDQNLLTLNERELATFRNEQVGFVFQLHHLLPQCTVLENVLIPSLVVKESREARARELLNRVGLGERIHHRPGQLSGGERQRAALVRALINKPKLLLADEPTGALNREGADELMDLLLELNREEQLTLVMVTHSMRLAGKLDRTLSLDGGLLREESGK